PVLATAATTAGCRRQQLLAGHGSPRVPEGDRGERAVSDSARDFMMHLQTGEELDHASASQTCRMFNGTGENRRGVDMEVNNHICPRCGGYGHLSAESENAPSGTNPDVEFARSNGLRPVSVSL